MNNETTFFDQSYMFMQLWFLLKFEDIRNFIL